MIGLYIALVLADAVLCWILIAVRGSWKIKAALIILAFVMNFFVLDAIPNPSGRATRQALPADAPFVSCYVEEPERIYFWLLINEAPKAYNIPYSRELHRTCDIARKARAQGLQIGIRRQQNERQGTVHGRYIPYILPSSLPSKAPRLRP